MPRVEKYEFGLIVIDGKEYKRDVILTPDGVEPEWWRREGHRLRLEDIRDVLERVRPQVLIVGTGYYGMVKVEDEVRDFLRERGIELVKEKTGEAVRRYNELSGRGVRVVAALHLTC